MQWKDEEQLNIPAMTMLALLLSRSNTEVQEPFLRKNMKFGSTGFVTAMNKMKITESTLQSTCVKVEETKQLVSTIRRCDDSDSFDDFEKSTMNGNTTNAFFGLVLKSVFLIRYTLAY